MCGFSGLPKFRQLVRPSGSAPVQARLAEHSSTASTAPRYGSTAPRRPLAVIATLSAGAPPSRAAIRRRRPAAAVAADRDAQRGPPLEQEHGGVARLGAADRPRADDA